MSCMTTAPNWFVEGVGKMATPLQWAVTASAGRAYPKARATSLAANIALPFTSVTLTSPKRSPVRRAVLVCIISPCPLA